MKKPLPSASLGRADEATVVALASLGEAGAFSELVKRRQSWLRNLMRRLCRDPMLADDLAQQTFLQAWRSINGLKAPGAFGAWLRRLAINTWLAHVRSQPDNTAARVHPWPAPTPTAAEQSEGSALEPSDTPSAGEQLDLDRALARLSADERLCVVLAYNEGMSHSEISAATRLPLGTVKSHIRRGAEQLRTFLQAYRPVEATRHVR